MLKHIGYRQDPAGACHQQVVTSFSDVVICSLNQKCFFYMQGSKEWWEMKEVLMATQQYVKSLATLEWVLPECYELPVLNKEI